MWVRGVVTGQSLVTLNDGRADATHDMRAHLSEATAWRMVPLFMLQFIVLIRPSSYRWQIVLIVTIITLAWHRPILAWNRPVVVLLSLWWGPLQAASPSRLKTFLRLLDKQILFFNFFFIVPGRNVFNLMRIYWSGPSEIGWSDYFLPIHAVFRCCLYPRLRPGTSRHRMVIHPRDISRYLVHSFLRRRYRIGSFQ